MAKDVLTDEDVELEIERLTASEAVRLAKKGASVQISAQTIFVYFALV